MLRPKRSLTTHPSQIRLQKRLTGSLQKRTKKVFNSSVGDHQIKANQKNALHKLRVFVSGILIVLGIVVFYVLKIISTESMNLNESFTVLIRHPSYGQASNEIVSFRGSEGGVNVTQHKGAATEIGTAFPIDEEIILEDSTTITNKQTLLAAFAPWNRSAQTAFSRHHRLQIWIYLLFMDSAQIQSQSLPNESTKLALFVQKFYSDSMLRKESPTIAIINTTTQNGVAKQYADTLNAWGFTVVQIDTQSNNPKEVTLLVRSAEFEKTKAMSRLQASFPHLTLAEDQNVLKLYRSQYVLYLGNDVLF